MVKQYKAIMGVVENTEHSPSPHNAGVEEMWAVANLDHRAKIGIVHKQLNFTQAAPPRGRGGYTPFNN